MRKILGILLCLVIVLTPPWPSSAFAQTHLPNLTNNQVQKLTEIKYNLSTIEDLENRGVINQGVAKTETEYYLNQAQTLINQQLTAEKLTNLLAKYQNNSVNSPTTWQRITGLFNFVNILWILSIILLTIALGFLTAIYLVPILAAIPKVVYEVLIYLACVSAFALGLSFEQGISEFIALPGCLGLIIALSLTNYLHREELQSFYQKHNIEIFSFYSGWLFLIWGGVAILYESSIIGFLAILALEVFLGFSVVAMPLSYFIGFTKREVVSTTTFVSFLLMVFYIGVNLTNTNINYLNIFAPGALFLGTFVYFIGLLIMSSKWYYYESVWYALDNKWPYIYLQLLTVVSGVGALYIGSVWQISQLNGIGGTFFFLYLIEKYWEITWKNTQWVWSLLGLAIILYSASFIIKQYPQYFLLSF
ncbi:MAG TPA: hypothetical protein VK184_27155 [Nostocaceae cyanobacterium]|nr:hypothetical protein [Nostocaceae cyanobacterium]